MVSLYKGERQTFRKALNISYIYVLGKYTGVLNIGQKVVVISKD